MSLGLLGGAIGLAAAVGAASRAAEPERTTPSGLPVPRYVSLKFDEVNARGGPGDDYKLLWTYRARGLPVQVVAETQDWRRVCDPQGGLAWVKATGVDGRRTVLNLQAQPIPLRSKPDEAAPVKAYLAAKAAASLDRCEGSWCKVKAASAAGWLPAAQVWGTAEARQCR
jgi:SH3-like domain-containing protein